MAVFTEPSLKKVLELASSELNSLKKVVWSPSGSRSILLSAEKFPHEFVGKDGTRPNPIHHAKQVHGTLLLEARTDQTSDTTLPIGQGDGIWSQKKGTTIAVKTADCLPVLLAHPPSRTVFAIHAGWRGLTAGILGYALEKAKDLGIDGNSLIGVLGPAISREQYEVGDEVIEAIFDGAIGLSPSQACLATAKGKDQKWHLDLKVAGVFALINGGILPENLEVIQACTYRESSWHSMRREGAGFGSNWAWITSP